MYPRPTKPDSLQRIDHIFPSAMFKSTALVAFLLATSSLAGAQKAGLPWIGLNLSINQFTTTSKVSWYVVPPLPQLQHLNRSQRQVLHIRNLVRLHPR